MFLTGPSTLFMSSALGSDSGPVFCRGMGGSAHEMAANAVAVEVIQVWGYSEREAVAMVGGMLCRRQARGAVEVGARPRD